MGLILLPTHLSVNRRATDGNQTCSTRPRTPHGRPGHGQHALRSPGQEKSIRATVGRGRAAAVLPGCPSWSLPGKVDIRRRACPHRVAGLVCPPGPRADHLHTIPGPHLAPQSVDVEFSSHGLTPPIAICSTVYAGAGQPLDSSWNARGRRLLLADCVSCPGPRLMPAAASPAANSS